MARLRFRKPKIAVLMSEIISLTVWLFLGDRIIDTLNTVVGTTHTLDLSTQNLTTGGCTNESTFEDAFEIMGIGYACGDCLNDGSQSLDELSNRDNGLLGVIGLVMVVMVLMNFVSYN